MSEIPYSDDTTIPDEVIYGERSPAEPAFKELALDEILFGSGKNYKEKLDALRNLYQGMRSSMDFQLNQMQLLVADNASLKSQVERLEKTSDKLWNLIDRLNYG